MTELLPALDLLGGEAVRLVRGDFSARTSYGDAVAIARRYAGEGARWLHVVDLAAARDGLPAETELVAQLVECVTPSGMQVQLGGGVRDAARAESLLEAGVARVVLGTAAVEQPSLLGELALAHPGRIAVGLDHRREAGSGRRLLAVAGWSADSALTLEEAVGRASALPLGALVVTDIGRDGTLGGPDLDGYAGLLASTELPVVASGGVSTLADLEQLAALQAGGRRLAGVVVGRALLEGRFSLSEGLAALAGAGRVA